MDHTKEFTIATITRNDLQALAFSDAEVASLSDEDMQEIARRVAYVIVTADFWLIVRGIGTDFLNESPEQRASL